jgi:tetratricopeptide (TPR) repeat protein
MTVARDGRDWLALARGAALTGADAEVVASRLWPDREHIATAIAAAAQRGDIEAALAAAANVWRLWSLSGDLAGGRAVLASVLDYPGAPRPSRDRGLALYADGLLAFRAGDERASGARNNAALAIARQLGDRELEALALTGLARVALRAGEYDRVCELAARARTLAPPDGAAAVPPLHLLAAGTRLRGQHDAARELYLESLALNRRLGDTRMVGVELHNLGYVELHRGAAASALAFFDECSLVRAVSSDPYDQAMEHLNRAARAHIRGVAGGDDLAAAERLLAAAGITLDPDDRYELDWLRSALSAAETG